MKSIKPKNILIEKEAQGALITKNVMQNINEYQLLDHNPQVKLNNKRAPINDKRILYLTGYRGNLLKPCPGTPSYICCGYRILNIGINCPMDCSYCILQAYINQPYLRVFANLEERLNEVAGILERSPKEVFRVGTGEFTDSLALDHITGWSRILLPFVSSMKNMVLELKTKTDNISGLLSLKERERVVVSWSLNTPWIISQEEKGTTSLIKRIKSARRCQKEGFLVGFHFDPLIYYKSWGQEIIAVIDLLDKYINPSRVIWISLGCMRFMPSLKDIIHERHPDSCVLDGEFIRGMDGKYRYFKPIRLEIYGIMKELLMSWSREPVIYLCMESSEIWDKSLGWTPRDSNELKRYLDDRAKGMFQMDL
jgi:spore photoproduct lyase